MLSKNINQQGIEPVESMLALLPEYWIVPEEASDSEWLRLEDKETAKPEREENSMSRASPLLEPRA
jgi:hypothetical protein